MRKSFWLIYLSIIFHIVSVEAQLSSPSEETETQEIATSQNDPGVGSIFYGQPGKAALYSLVVPGGGQFYNRRYWKVPIIWGVEGFALAHLISNINASRDATLCWRATLGDIDASNLSLCSDEILSLDPNSPTQRTEAFAERQSARSGKDLAWILMSVAHLFNVVEAFVDRHLINFDTTEDLSLHNRPNPNLTGKANIVGDITLLRICLLYTSPSPRDQRGSRMPTSA